MKPYPFLSIFFLTSFSIIEAQNLIPVTGYSSVTTCSGIVTDPGGLGNYPNNANGIFTISPSEPDKKIVLIFNSFSIFSDTQDRLDLYDGPSTVSSAIGGYIQNSPATITASNLTGEITLKFFSNGSSNDEGFSATIGCVSSVSGVPVYQVPLSDKVTVSGCNANVTDHNIFGSYSRNANGTLTILPNSPNQSVNLAFSSFSLSSSGSGDYLTIYNGVTTTSPSLGKYNSSSQISTITATNLVGALTLQFKSSSSTLQSSGFNARLTCVTTTPGQVGFIPVPFSESRTVTGCSGIITDPNGFENYLSNSYGKLTILPTSPGLNVRLNFTAFNMYNGVFDYLTVYDNNSATGKSFGTFSNGTSVGTLTATNPSGGITLDFNGYTGGQQGFSASLSCYNPADYLYFNGITTDISFRGTTIENAIVLTVSSGLSWNIQTTATGWFTISTTSGGAGVTLVSLNVTPNGTTQTRYADLIINNGLSTVKKEIYQLYESKFFNLNYYGNNVTSIAGSNLGETLLIIFNTSSKFSIIENSIPNWLNFDVKQSNTSKYVYMTIKKDLSNAVLKTAKIKILYGINLQDTSNFTVYQDPSFDYLYVTNSAADSVINLYPTYNYNAGSACPPQIIKFFVGSSRPWKILNTLSGMTFDKTKSNVSDSVIVTIVKKSKISEYQTITIDNGKGTLQVNFKSNILYTINTAYLSSPTNDLIFFLDDPRIRLLTVTGFCDWEITGLPKGFNMTPKNGNSCEVTIVTFTGTSASPEPNSSNYISFKLTNCLDTLNAKKNDGIGYVGSSFDVRNRVTLIIDSISNKLQIIPNPAGRHISITNGEGFSISIYNSLGNLLLKSKITSEPINIETFSNGLYLVNIEKHGRNKLLKLIVER